MAKAQVIYIGALRGVMATAGTGVHSQPLPFCRGEAVGNPAVEIDECIQHSARRIELERQSAFGEVDLHACATLPHCASGPEICGPTGTAAMAPHPQFSPPPLTAGTIEISEPVKTGLRSPPV
jgi:hypothetical protein